ncbi:MAG TPA: TadE family protein [Dehalococcoidia bacterium]|nr:TadE family protein [Dehalococcoidia bacterium]
MRLPFSKRKGRKRETAQAMVEFGIVALAFFLLLFGLFDMTRMFQSWITVQHAAREGARYAITGRIDCDGSSPGRDTCITWEAKDQTEALNNAGQGGTDVNVTFRAWDYVSNDWPGAGTALKSGKQCDQVEVTVTYTHHFVTPLLEVLAPGGVTLKGSQRMTNEPFGPCNSGDGVG